MEIKQYLLLARKWIWLVILGAAVGGAIAYFFSLQQPEIYETSTQVMVSAAPDETGGNPYYIYNDLKLTTTYAQLIPTDPVLIAVSEQLGFPIHKNQIKVRQIPDSLLLEVKVTDSDPERAALTANSLIEVFIEHNENLQMSRFASSELSLQAQISQVESQIANLEIEMSQFNQQNEETQEIATQERLDELQSQMDMAEEEIIKLQQQLVKFTPTPLPATSTPEDRWSATATPAPTPTTSPIRLAEFLDLQQQLDRWNTLRDLYKSTYASLLVSGNSANNATGNANLRQSQLQTTMALYQQIYTNLLNNYEAIRLARLRSTPNVVQIEPASIPAEPIQPQPLRNALIGGFFGAFLMASIAFLVEYMDDTLKTPEDVHQHLQVPVIGLIGEMDRPKGRKRDDRIGVYVAENPLSPITEAFRTLRTNLEFASVDKPIKTLLITSTQPAEGKTTLAVNLAMIMAQGDKRVVLIDTDLRKPSVHRYLGIPNRTGLTDAFRSNYKLANIITPWGDPQIAAITSGGLPPNPTELLSSERMTKIITELKEMVDIVVLDAPPGIVADPIVLAAQVDGVVLVIEPGKTKLDSAQVLMEQLNRAGARIVGAVLNPISRRRAHYYSKYRYYSAYYYGREYGRYFSGNGASQSKRDGKKPKQEEQPEVSTQAD
jgi:capsular exopolysaccharide synthesis family protein